MYLACLYAENFRIFGAAPQKDGDKDASLSLDFGPATNVLVGENDSGKTAIHRCDPPVPADDRG
ncbi:hypothetical protein OG285_06220 [Streptomyces sp. NBC_01471]|uniref:hypothetical protein n=1 Tax=Streptomyces sp. NBC_01471 TaxID=2903879 RepID=UPI003246A0C4